VKLSLKIFLFTIFPFLVISLLFNIYQQNVLFEMLKENRIKNEIIHLKAVKNSIIDNVQKIENTLHLISILNNYEITDIKKKKNELELFLYSFDSIKSLSIMDNIGNEWIKVDRFQLFENSMDELDFKFNSNSFQIPMLKNSIFVGNLSKTVYGQPQLIVSSAIRNLKSGEKIGVLEATVFLQFIQPLFEKNNDNEFLILIDKQSDSVVIKTGIKDLIDSNNIKNILDNSSVQELIHNKEKYILIKENFVYKNLNLLLMTAIAITDINSALDDIKKNNIISSVATLIILMLISIILINRLINSINTIINEMIEESQKYEKSNIQISQKDDEISNLKKVFHIFKGTIEHKTNEINELNSSLETKVKEQTAELKNNYTDSILALVDAIEQRDSYTAGHSKRVAIYSKMIAEVMGFNKKECEDIYTAGILHDIGKISTPDKVLLKPSRLSKIEYDIIKEHASVGAEILSNVTMYKDIVELMKYHHEKYDGTGYPNGLKGDEIPLISHIMIVADAFDAMTTNRIYKPRKSVSEAIKELKEFSGTQFHPKVVEYAVDILKDVKVDTSIHQKPKTRIEKERFAYFYKDNLTGLYNEYYLDTIISNRFDDLKFQYRLDINLRGFSKLNHEQGWKKGDDVLKEYASFLLTKFSENDAVFRIQGDDFVILSNIANKITQDELEIPLLQYQVNIEISTQKI
jgi:putative nucleotidyltransferase with HDIG domain